jgi:hypothetical protein
MNRQANSERKLRLVPSGVANHVNVVDCEPQPVSTQGGPVRNYPRRLKARELKLLEVEDDYLPTFLKWTRLPARLAEGETIFNRGPS